MLDEVQGGSLEEWQWRKIIEKMYDPSDYEVLEQRFLQIIQDKKYEKLGDSNQLL
jgi:hypothetical protein